MEGYSYTEREEERWREIHKLREKREGNSYTEREEGWREGNSYMAREEVGIFIHGEGRGKFVLGEGRGREGGKFIDRRQITVFLPALLSKSGHTLLKFGLIHFFHLSRVIPSLLRYF